MSTINAFLTTGTLVTISNGRHTWQGDEPAVAGGMDEGPNPYEMLLGALAACTCITIAMYCQHKGLVLAKVTTNYEFDRIHAEDCEDCDHADRGFLEQVVASVHIEGQFDEAQKKRLTQIAARCPVHKTLAHGVRIEDKVSFG